MLIDPFTTFLFTLEGINHTQPPRLSKKRKGKASRSSDSDSSSNDASAAAEEENRTTQAPPGGTAAKDAEWIQDAAQNIEFEGRAVEYNDLKELGWQWKKAGAGQASFFHFPPEVPKASVPAGTSLSASRTLQAMKKQLLSHWER